MSYFALSMLGLTRPVFPNAITAVIGILDIDSDGDLDLVIGWTGDTALDGEGNVVGPETPLLILANDGSGNYSDATASLFPGGAPAIQMSQKSFVGDFNGDGRPDLYMPDHGPESGSWPGGPGNLLLSSGAHGVVDGSSFLTGLSQPTHDLTIGDIDNDGDDDVIQLIAGGPHHFHLIVSDPVAGMTIADDQLPFVSFNLHDPGNPYDMPSPICAELIDADRDGDLDLFLPTTQFSASLLLFNDGAGNFSYGANNSSVLPHAMPGHETIVDSASADFNGDGAIDVAVFGFVQTDTGPGDNFTAVYFGNGAGGFTVGYVGPGSGLMNVADFNNDGYQDIVTDGPTRTFLLNDGRGNFIETADLTGVGNWFVRFTATDLNQDGRTDFIGYSFELGGDVAIFYGQDQPLTQTGDGGANTILGDRDNETLSGLGGDDIIFAAQGTDTLNGGDGADYLNGGQGNDTVYGGDGNDTIDGGTGTDTMYGGNGDDIYIVNTSADQTIEAPGSSGIDLVKSYVTRTLGDQLENLTLVGSSAIWGTGNGLDNVITGNAAANRLIGAAGNDTLIGGNGDDLLIGGTGADTINGGSGVDTLDYSASDAAVVINLSTNSASGGHAAGDVISNCENIVGSSSADSLTGNNQANILNGGNGNDTLSGMQGNDTLNGGAGDDYLDGGSGTDIMVGGAGNDTYVVTTAADVTTEVANGDGIDLVLSSVTRQLGSFLENLTLTGAGDIWGTGNTLANTITGNSGANRLNGGAGNDTLSGGLGADQLIGGAGADKYVFDSALGGGNIDRISDFSVVDDTILLENAIFTGLANGTLAAGAFRIGTAAADADDRIIYNSATGALLWDADGNGAGAAIQFATLSTGLALTNADFLVI